jgi:hypothetical protein
MTKSTTQTGIHTTNRLAALYEEPETFVSGDVSWMPYDPRWHRTHADNFPRVEGWPHPRNPELMIDCCVRYEPDYGDHGRLTSTACGVRLKHGVTTRMCCGSVETTLADELFAEKRVMLNQ